MDGLAWPQLLRDFARHCGWLPDQVLFGQTLGQFLLAWCPPGGGGHDPDAVRAGINKRRAKKGLPPMKPKGS